MSTLNVNSIQTAGGASPVLTADIAKNSELIASSGSSLVGHIASGAGGVATTVQAKLRESVSVKDFGAVGDGVTDDTAAIQAAVNTAGTDGAVYFPTPSVSYYITSQLTLFSNQKIYGDGSSSHIQLKDGTHHGFWLSGLSGVSIRDLKISCKSQTNDTAYIGAVVLSGCANCLVENVGVFNGGYWGVALINSSACVVRGCRFSSFFTAIQNSADISVTGASSENLIDGNFCFATTNNHGIELRALLIGDQLISNTVVNNQITGHTAYGIVHYTLSQFDTQAIIKGNRVSGVLGTAIAGASGAGIYLQAASGAIVEGNQVTDCCKSTSNFATLAMAHIVANGAQTSGKEMIIANNNIQAFKGPAIGSASCYFGPVISGNTIVVEATGTNGVKLTDSHGSKVVNNTIRVASAEAGILVNASNNAEVGNVFNGVDILDNKISVTATGIYFFPTTTGVFQNANVSNNRVYGGNSYACTLDKVTNSVVVGNNFSSSGFAFYGSNSPNLRMSANRIYSSAAYPSYGIGFDGNTSGVVDESNQLEGVMLHNTTGVLNIIQFGNAAPAFGSHYWGVGDRVIQSVPVVGQPKGWRCTVAGGPGTWVSEGNL